MTYSEERYREVEKVLDIASRDFDDSHENDELARTLVVTTRELERIHCEFKHEYGDETGERHVFQDTFFASSHSTLSLTASITYASKVRCGS